MRRTAEVIVDLQLGPIERQLGVAYIGDVDLDEGHVLVEGSAGVLRDEGGHRYEATVLSVEPGRYGRTYRLTFHADVPPFAEDLRGCRGKPE